ncbi:Hsp20/alpha crystallin family protein [Patescibacteria group bacterium]|nr:Hsp20/alpha crystallin family protein [Patescibacteria group bacterium]
MHDAPWLDAASAPFPIRKAGVDARPFLPENEGALSVDVHEYPDALIVRAPIAGVRPVDLDLSLHNDMLTIRGKRADMPLGDADCVTLHQECHWGPFSRSIILPIAVRADDAEARLVDGVLTIRLPKTTRYGTIPLTRFSSV